MQEIYLQWPFVVYVCLLPCSVICSLVFLHVCSVYAVHHSCRLLQCILGQQDEVSHPYCLVFSRVLYHGQCCVFEYNGNAVTSYYGNLQMVEEERLGRTKQQQGRRQGVFRLMLLWCRTKYIDRFNPYQRFEKCRICKQQVHQVGSHYCQGNCCYGIHHVSHVPYNQ